MTKTSRTLTAAPMSHGGHALAILTLGLPLIGGQVAQFAVGLTDTIMLGWYGVSELAAVTLATSYYFVWFILGAGFAFAVMPMIAAALAQDDHRRIRRATRMGLWMSMLYGVLAMPLLWYAEPILLALGQEVQVASDAGAYLRIAGWAVFPSLIGMVMKSYLSGLERTQVVFWIAVLGAVVNGCANYVLIFGSFGAPELGLKGAALASVMTNSVTCAAILIYALRQVPEHALLQNLWKPDWEMLREIMLHGASIGVTTVSEVSLFTISALMMGWLGTVALAAHGIAISIAGLTFMVHLGLSNASTIRVGNALGRGDKAHMVRGAYVVLTLSLVIAALTAVLFLVIPEPLIAVFLDPSDPERDAIMATGVGLLAMAGLFQLMDATQAIALGLLRGLLDTGLPMVMAAFGYLGVGMPSAYVFGFVLGWGGVGVWAGLVLGLTTAGALLMGRFWLNAVPRFEARAAQRTAAEGSRS